MSIHDEWCHLPIYSLQLVDLSIVEQWGDIRGRSGRIAHLTFIRIKHIQNANPSIGNLPHGKLRYLYLV